MTLLHGYVMFSDPAACVQVSAGSMLNRLPSGVLDRYAFVCPYGTFNLNAGAGNSSSYTGTCQKCPAKALCVGGANAPQCERGTYSIDSGQGHPLDRSLFQLNLSRFVPDSA